MRFASLVCASLIALAACSGDAGTTPDAGPPDAEATPDANAACPFPTAALPYPWRPIDAVSTGQVTIVSEMGGVTTATIDATAGGPTPAENNPYIYVDLMSGTVVAISDVESYSAQGWDIALKRQVIRVNSGDSGPGGVEAATQFGITALAQIGEPAENDYLTDDWATDNCDLVEGPLGEPRTAIGEWYEYDVNTHQLTPLDQGYVIRRADGTRFKFFIETYYGDGANPMRGAYYRVLWATF